MNTSKPKCLLFFILTLAPFLVQCSKSPGPEIWTDGWKESEPMLKGRTGSVAVGVNGHLFVMGGGFGTPGPDTVLREVERAAIRKNGEPGPWETVQPMLTPRIFPAATVADGVIYVVGGEYFPGGEMLLLNTVEWARVDKKGRLGPWKETRVMQTPRRWPTIAVVEGHLYAMGGYNGTFLRSVERAKILEDGSLGPWEYLPGQLTTERYIHGGAAIGNRIYVVGGHLRTEGDGLGGAEWATVESTGKLTPWQPTSSMLQPRFLSGSSAGDASIFVVGGYNGGYLSSVEWAEIMPDGNLGKWQTSTSLPSPREGPATVIYDGKIYSMGGSDQGKFLRSTLWAEIREGGKLGTWRTGEK